MKERILQIFKGWSTMSGPSLRMASIIGACLIVLLSSCRGSDAPAAKGAWRAGEEWRLVEETRIGAVDEGPAAFGSIVDVALDPMGRVWVADGRQHQIRVFDTLGNHVRSVGRKGGGPADFAGISGVEWGPDGRLWVLDGGNARFAVYDTAGTLLETHARNSILTTTPWPGRFDVENRLYDVAGSLERDGSVSTLVVRSAAGALPRDTFRVPRFEPELFKVTGGDARNRIVTEINVPFTGNQFWGIDSHGYVWIANTARYRIERHRFDGQIDRFVERPHIPVPVSARDRSRMLENYREFIRHGGKIDESRIPRNHAALNGFYFDDTGHMWVSPTSSPSQERVLDVFETGGKYLGRVSFPVPQLASVRTIRGNRMVVVARDSLDVQTVIVIRIERQAR
jgi:sugar lactone lactonase YvrE